MAFSPEYAILDNFDVHSVTGATYGVFGPTGAHEDGGGSRTARRRPFDVDDFATAMIKLAGGATY